MRRLAFILFGVVAAVSLALGAASAVFWVRGYWYDDHVSGVWERPDAYRYLHLWSYRGGFAFLQVRYGHTPADTQGLTLEGMMPFTWRSGPSLGGGWERGYGRPAKWRFAGFAWLPRENNWSVVFPAWCPAMVFLTVPAVYVVLWRRRRRRQVRAAGVYCATCGYDLRATPGRCPECGTVVAGAVATPE